MDNLRTLKNIPITNITIGGLFPELVGKNQKVRELEKLGEIIRLKRGLYVVSPKKKWGDNIDRTDSESSVWAFVCLHAFSLTLLWSYSRNGLYDAVDDHQTFP